MKFYRRKSGPPVAAAAVDMQHGEPKLKWIGMGAPKMKKLTKRQSAYAAPGYRGGTRTQIARHRFRLVESGKLPKAAAAGLERDYAKEFARFRAQARRAAAEAKPQDPAPGAAATP